MPVTSEPPKGRQPLVLPALCAPVPPSGRSVTAEEAQWLRSSGVACQPWWWVAPGPRAGVFRLWSYPAGRVGAAEHRGEIALLAMAAGVKP